MSRIILDAIAESTAKFVDLRFTDTLGKEQHVTVPVPVMDASLTDEGKMFDGSSIAGWKGINDSDMILMPAPARSARELAASPRRIANPVRVCGRSSPLRGYPPTACFWSGMNCS